MVLAGGPSEAIDQVSPIFASIAKRVFIVGEEPFRANVVKLCGNSILLSSILALAQTITFARAHDIDASQLLELLTETLFTAPFYKLYGSLMVGEAFKPAGYSVELALKDADLLIEGALRVGVSMSSMLTVRDKLRDAVQQGLGELDVSALSLVTSICLR